MATLVCAVRLVPHAAFLVLIPPTGVSSTIADCIHSSLQRVCQMIRRAAGCSIHYYSQGVYLHTAATAPIVCGLLLSAAAEVCDRDTSSL
jgi:hypothetical protein